MQFQYVAGQLSSLFLVLMLGFVLRKIKLFNNETTTHLTKFVLNVTLPAFIITSMQLDFSSAMLVNGGITLGISLLCYGLFFVVSYPIVWILRPCKKDFGVYQFFLIFSNTAFMGYPVIKAVFGDKALFYGSIFNLPFNLLVFTLGVWLLKKESGHKIEIKSFINPTVVSIILGFVLFAFSIKLPPIINTTAQSVGNITTPASMFILGLALGEIEIKKIFTGWRVYVIVLARLLIVPLIVYLVLKPFIHDTLMLGVPVIISAMPCAANTTLIAIEYDADAELASKGVFLSSLLCIVTIPLIALLF